MEDEEFARSREGQGEEEDLRNNFSKRIGRNQRDYDTDEIEINNEADKSREERKHDRKERKKERQHKNDYGRQDMDDSKQRGKDDTSGRDTEYHGSKEKVGSSRDKKEYLGDHSKDRDPELEKEKVREKIRTKDYDRINHREDWEYEQAKEKGRKYDKGKDTDHGRERSIDREREEVRDHGNSKVRDHGKDKGREGKYKGKQRDRYKDIDSNRDQSIGRERDQSRYHVKDRAGEGEKEKESGRDRGMHREHERGKERDKVYDHHRDRHKDSEIDKDKTHDEIDRELERDGLREKDRERVKDKEMERDRVREKDHERGKDREKEKDHNHYWSKEKEREKLKDLEKEAISEKIGERGKFKKLREKEVAVAADQDRSSGRDTERNISRDKEAEVEENFIDPHEVDAQNKISFGDHSARAVASQTSSVLAERLKKVKDERMNGNSEAVSEVLSWVNKSRKLEEKRNSENEKAIALARKLDEQDKILDESEDEESIDDSGKYLAGVKVLHGLDKVMEGAAVVLTLKDQNILADGDVNEEVDMLESVEIGEQKRRNEAYSAAKKKTGIYADKFNEDLISQKTMLPQYDDPVADEGVTLDESGRFTGEAEKKLSELRKRIERSTLKKDYADLSSSGKIQSDYFTTDEMLQFKKPKKKKSLRKKERLNLDALEAEARVTGLGVGDLGTRGDVKRLSAREVEEKNLAEARSNAYQAALIKAEEASKFLRQGPSSTSKSDSDESLTFGEDYEDLRKSLDQSRKLTLKKQEEVAPFGPHAVALLATALREQDNAQASAAGDTQENKVVITEMEEFVLGLQINEDANNPETEDVFKDDEDYSVSVDRETNRAAVGWTEEKETELGELPTGGDIEDISPDEIIHETAVGKGLSGALKLLQDRGTLKESIDWGGRNMDKRKSKLVGIYANDGSKEIRIERTDEFGRILTPKEAFRILSHKFHGKGPGKMKQEKRMNQYYEDLKTKQMKASDTPLLAMEKMREAQSRLKTPYLVLSGHVKPGQTSDPRSGFAMVEKDNPGSLTPMLGDKKVEHFLGIRHNKPEPGSMGPPPAKKPKL